MLIVIVRVTALLSCLLPTVYAVAEIRTISATGEYRMNNNDTPADGKRLALFDAKQMALEQAGTYIESITQVKDLDLAREEIRTYAAGIVEVVELATRTALDGNTPTVYVDVRVKVDTDDVARQIGALRLDDNAKAELGWLRRERTRLTGELQTQSRELAALQSDAEIARVRKHREQLISNVEANDLFARAVGALKASVSFSTSLKLRVDPERNKAGRELVDRGLELDPLHPTGHILLAFQFDYVDKNHTAAIRELRTVLRVAAEYGLDDDIVAGVHSFLAEAFAKDGKQAAAIQEYRTSIRLQPRSPYPHYGLAVVLMKMKGTEKEEAHELKEYLRLAPDSSTALEKAVKEQIRVRLRMLEH